MIGVDKSMRQQYLKTRISLKLDLVYLYDLCPDKRQGGNGTRLRTFMMSSSHLYNLPMLHNITIITIDIKIVYYYLFE